MANKIVIINLFLVSINLLLALFSIFGLFHGRDLLPFVTGAITILVSFLSLFIKRTDRFLYRIIGFMLVIGSSIGVIHAHFNIYNARIEANARNNALELLKSGTLPPINYVYKINAQDNLTISDILNENNYLVINFWATWCPPCLQEMPELNSFYKEYKRRGIEVLGFTDFKKSKEEKEINKIKSVIDKLKVSYPILISDSEKIRSAYGAEVLPATVLIDHSGKIIDYEIGIEGSSKIIEFLKRQIKATK